MIKRIFIIFFALGFAGLTSAVCFVGPSIKPISNTKPLNLPNAIYQAVVAAEDPKFYKNFYQRNTCLITSDRCRSTLRIAVAKILMPSDATHTEWHLHPIFVTLRMSILADSSKVLDFFLGQAYFGRGAYGVDQAAQSYFNKGAEQLDLHEVALLAALLKAPSDIGPDSDLAIARRDTVLRKMYDMKFISPQEYQASILMPMFWINP